MKVLGYYLRGCSDYNDDGKRFPYIDLMFLQRLADVEIYEFPKIPANF